MSIKLDMTGRASALKKELCHSLISHFCKDVMARKQINIEIAFKRRLDMEAEGRCWNLDHQKRNPRNFRIELATTTPMRTLINLAHELVHLQQYVDNRWLATKEGELWNGSMVAKEIADDGSRAYWNHPWEIEAYGRQLGIVMIWMEESGVDSSRWYERPF